MDRKDFQFNSCIYFGYFSQLKWTQGSRAVGQVGNKMQKDTTQNLLIKSEIQQGLQWDNENWILPLYLWLKGNKGGCKFWIMGTCQLLPTFFKDDTVKSCKNLLILYSANRQWVVICLTEGLRKKADMDEK